VAKTKKSEKQMGNKVKQKLSEGDMLIKHGYLQKNEFGIGKILRDTSNGCNNERPFVVEWRRAGVYEGTSAPFDEYGNFALNINLCLLDIEGIYYVGKGGEKEILAARIKYGF
jgi:hypothetical protein